MTTARPRHVCDGRDLSCFGCADVARTRDLVRDAMTRDDQLDDLTRARIWNALEPRLVPAVARTRRRFASPVAIGAAFAAAAAIVVIVLASRGDESRTLTVAEGAALSSPIGPHTRAGLVGPAKLEVVRTGPATAVRLRRGIFLADFDGGPGRSLRIEAPGASIEVVGTLFAVEARATSSCISVAHGTVRVTTSTITRLVTNGEAFCTDTGARPIAPPTEHLLVRHELSLTASNAHPARDRAIGARSAPARDRDLDLGAIPSTAPSPASPSPATSPMPPTAPSPPTTPAPSPPSATATSHSKLAPVKTNSSKRQTVTSPAARPSLSASPRTSSSPPTVQMPSAQPTSPAPPPVSPRTSSSPSTTQMPAAQRSVPSAPSPSSSSTRSPPPPPIAPPPAIAKPTADELYRTAERALAARDSAAADRALDRLVTEYPTSPLGEQALYERARMAHHKRAWATARRHLDRLLALPRPRLAEPARYLVCRIAVEARDDEATSCLVEYRKSYPRSPHDLDVLALLVEREHASGGCRAAAAYIAELSRAHPKSELARAWQARCARP